MVQETFVAAGKELYEWRVLDAVQKKRGGGICHGPVRMSTVLTAMSLLTFERNID